MPLPDQSGFVAGLTQHVRDIRRVGIGAGKRIVQRSHGVDVRVLSGQDDCSAGRADRIRDKALVESNSFSTDAIDIRSGSDFRQPASVGTDRVAGMIVRHDKQNVRTSF